MNIAIVGGQPKTVDYWRTQPGAINQVTGAAPTAKKAEISPVERELEDCRRGLHELTCAMDNLRSRLDDVLTPPSLASEPPGRAPVSGSPLVCRVKNLKEDIANCLEILQDIGNRLEV